jgi:hypothetical protein
VLVGVSLGLGGDFVEGRHARVGMARARWPLACALSVCVWLVLGVGVAFGARGHVAGVPFSFGEGVLSDPVGVAVDEASGLVYVADRGHDRVVVFDQVSRVVVGEFDGSGLLAGEGAAAGSGVGEEPTGRFSGPTWVAVDNACRFHKPVLTGVECEAFDPSAGDVYVVDSGHDVVDKYTAAGGYVGQISAKSLRIGETLGATRFFPETVGGVVVQRDGSVLISAQPDTPVFADQKGVFRVSDGGPGSLPAAPVFMSTVRFVALLEGLASASGGGFYFPITGDGGGNHVVVEFGGSGEIVSEGVFSGVVSGLGGELCSGDVYVDDGSAVTRLDSAGNVVEVLEVVGGGGAGVVSDCAVSSLSVFVASSVGGGRVDVFGPEPPGLPSIEAGSVAASGVTSDGVTLTGRVNPRSNAGEAATEYEFEYGACPVEGSCVGVPFTGSVSGTLPASYEVASVSAEAVGLVPLTRYHGVLRASNAHGPASLEEEVVFVTQSATPTGLLDGRGWELVSPVDKHGANLLGIGESEVSESAAGGGAFTFPASSSTESDPVGNANVVQVFARRSASGWGSCDVGLPHAGTTGTPIGSGQEYVGFSEDLGLGLVRPAGPFIPVTAGESESGPLLAGFEGSCGARPALRPLVTGCPASGVCAPAVQELADVPAGTAFGEEGNCSGVGQQVFCGPRVLGANSDLGATVFSSGASLGSVEGTPVPAGGLYEWHSGHVGVVSVLPSGVPVGFRWPGGSLPPVLGSQLTESLRGAVSQDGERVVWSEDEGGGHLFVWDAGVGRSVMVDGGSGAGPVQPVFQFMSPDGSRVYFTDTQRLTGNAGAASGKPDLYVCDVVVEEGEVHCLLTDLTPLTGGESAGVRGQVIGEGPEGSVFLVANGVLTGEANARGEKAVPGDCEGFGVVQAAQVCNLYGVGGSGGPVFVGGLSGSDTGEWGRSTPGVAAHVAGRVVGGWLVFMSSRSLTGFDNRDARRVGVRDEEVFLYHVGSGGLVCVSCDPSGARPAGVEYEKINGGVAGGSSVWPAGAVLAGSVPGWTPFRFGEALYQSRYLSGTGRVFFDSPERLVAGDGNNVEDVYEFEPAGVGGCRAGSAGFVVVDGGCLGLVSSGESSQESGFLDASVSGDDVFFLTSGRLVGRDVDTSLDVYDARVGGGETVASVSGGCVGGGCGGPVSPPEALIPGSSVFEGPGSPLIQPPVTKPKPRVLTRAQKLSRALAACRKRPRRERAGGVRKARKAFGVAHGASGRRAGVR